MCSGETVYLTGQLSLRIPLVRDRCLSGSRVCSRECRCDSFRIGCADNFRRNRGIVRYKLQKFGMSGGCICSGLQLYARRGVHFHALVRSNPEEAVRVVATAVEFRTGRNDFNLDCTARRFVLEIRILDRV
jgi:hypothetical protein